MPTRRIDKLTSQMDFAPPLLGLLHWDHPSRFFGHEVRRVEPAEAHALLGNYQVLGHTEGDELVVLKPVRSKRTYILDQETLEYSAAPPSIEGETEAIGFYQTASYMYNQNLYRELSTEEFQRYSLLRKTLAAVSAFSPVGLR